MQNEQKGFTFTEVLAYLAIYGVISASIIGGLSVMLREANIKKDISEIALVEKEVRQLAMPLSNYSTDFQKSPFLCAFYNTSCTTSGSKSLEDFLCDSGFTLCQSGEVETSGGTPFTVTGPGTVNNTAFSFAIIFSNLPYAYCQKFASHPWGRNVANIKIGSTNFPEGREMHQDAGVTTCSRGNNNTFSIYYR